MISEYKNIHHHNPLPLAHNTVIPATTAKLTAVFTYNIKHLYPVCPLIHVAGVIRALLG